MDYEALLRRVVIAYDSDDDEEYVEAIATARDALGLRLADDAEDALEGLKTKHMSDGEDDDRQERRDQRMRRVR